MTHLTHNKTIGTFKIAAASVVLASFSWSLPATAADDAMTELLGTLRQRGTISEAEYQRMKPQAEKQAAAASSALSKDALKKDWFGKMSIRGYAQTRYTHVLGSTMDGTNPLNVPADPSVAERDTFLLRRARMIFSGDVHDHLYIYAQIDYQGSVYDSYGEKASSGLQTRDFYGDVSLDSDKEHRIRTGISKVPYGFVNMQSSQNRLSVERPEALNSAVEGERDLGVYYMWADKVARERFKDLVKLGLKGSGDYGVFTVGAYNGQGLNKYDGNRSPHTVVHLAYPFQLDGGQYFELGMSAYQGKFVVDSKAPANTQPITTNKNQKEYTDRRVAANFVWYPKPFGLEAEWTYGEGPETIVKYDSFGKGTLSTQGITTENLHGGYVLVNYKADTDYGPVIPFSRWNYFDGARKFAANAPSFGVNEFDFGIEYQPWPSFEVTLVYTHAQYRTNTSIKDTGAGVYNLAKNADRLTLQLQYNF